MRPVDTLEYIPDDLQMLGCKMHQDDKLPKLELYSSLCMLSLVAE